MKAAIKAYLNRLPNCWYFLPVSNGMGSMGIPDIIICYKGVFVGVECKAPGRERSTTPLQDRNITAINHAFGHAIVASGVETVKTLIESIDAALAHRLGPVDTQTLVAMHRRMVG